MLYYWYHNHLNRDTNRNKESWDNNNNNINLLFIHTLLNLNRKLNEGYTIVPISSALWPIQHSRESSIDQIFIF